MNETVKIIEQDDVSSIWKEQKTIRFSVVLQCHTAFCCKIRTALKGLDSLSPPKYSIFIILTLPHIPESQIII
jgi:hypothetical protein